MALASSFPFRLPFIPVNEGAGVVEEVGAEASGIKAGDREEANLYLIGKAPTHT